VLPGDLADQHLAHRHGSSQDLHDPALLLLHDALRDRHAEAERRDQEEDRESERNGALVVGVLGIRVEQSLADGRAGRQLREVDPLLLGVGRGHHVRGRSRQRGPQPGVHVVSPTTS
jgi:hypothetical protein